MNKRTLTLTDQQYIDIITAIKSGFCHAGREYKPNERITTALTLEANLGMRISDILQLHLFDIIKDGDQYRIKNHMSEQQRLFDLSERQIQKHLQAACTFLGLNGISTHSFRKYFATQIYINNGYNIELVRQLLQHSSAAVTQKYIGIQQKQIETALLNHIKVL